MQVRHVSTGEQRELTTLVKEGTRFILLQAKPQARWDNWDRVTALKNRPVTEEIMLCNGSGEHKRIEGSTFLADPEQGVW